MGNKSYGLASDMDPQLASAKLRTTVGWDHIRDYTHHDHHTWYTELSCHMVILQGLHPWRIRTHFQAVDNYTFKTPGLAKIRRG